MSSIIAQSLLIRRSPFPNPAANITVTIPLAAPHRQLTTGSWNNCYPAWSPGGTKTACSASSTIFTVFLIWNVDDLTTPSIGPVQAGVSALQPAWCADGANIAFNCNLSVRYHVWVMPVAGGAVAQISASYYGGARTAGRARPSRGPS